MPTAGGLTGATQPEVARPTTTRRPSKARRPPTTCRWGFLAILIAGFAVMTAVPAVAQDAVAQNAVAQDGGTAVFGTLRPPSEDISLEGVTIIAERDGEQVAEAQVSAEGTWEIPLEQGGTYTVTIQQDSLPDGVQVRDEESATREVTVEDGGRTPVLFSLVAGDAGGVAGSETLQRVIDLSVSGIQLGAIIAITSIGLSLIFGVTGLINFAHGEMVTLGAFVALMLNTTGGPATIHLIPAALIAIIAGAGFGYILERGTFGPLRRRGTGLVALLVISIGLSILFRYGTLAIFGGLNTPYRNYSAQPAMSLGPIEITPSGLVVTVLALLVLGGVGLLLTRTQLGTAIRAVADNRSLAESSGIDVERVILAVWVSGGALAALGGVFQGVSQGVTWDMGFRLLLLMFAGVILGGLGTAFGAMVGGLVVGIAIQVSTLWFSVELKRMFAFGLLILVLLIRPTGILGRKERVG